MAYLCSPRDKLLIFLKKNLLSIALALESCLNIFLIVQILVLRWL